MGATLYGSGPLYAPEDKDGTFLLAPGQKGYYVPGEAWGALRYRDYASSRVTGSPSIRATSTPRTSG